ncbi:MAG: hypothetical protein HQL69_15175 [Magnetococcales bacterium]|nr:hypothetical protein [Magnetococcales bacterium]
MKNGKEFKSVGRPKLTQELRDTAIRMAQENIMWGYRRVVGELKKFGILAYIKARILVIMSLMSILNRSEMVPSNAEKDSAES